MSTPCPFEVGDAVRFDPDDRAIGWSYASFEEARIQPGDEGVVTRISEGEYLYLDDGRGGFHWECFKLVRKKSDETKPDRG